MKAFWDQNFSGETYIYGTSPNSFIKDQIKDLQPGTILFPCEGEGRNVVFAAKHGWEAYATDQSTAGMQKALQLADQQGVKINYQVADILEYKSDNEQLFDVIVMVFGHFPPHVREKAHRHLLSMLKPGGYMILEGFNKKQINNNSGGPKNVDMLYSKEELMADFEGLDIHLLEETQTHLDEGDWHQGMAEVIRLKGQKINS